MGVLRRFSAISTRIEGSSLARFGSKPFERLRSGRLTKALADTRPENHESTLLDPIEWLPVWRGRMAKAIAKMKLKSVYDLLTHFPKEYHLRRPLWALTVDTLQETTGQVIDVNTKTTRNRRMKITEVTIDDRGSALTLTFFNQPYLFKQFRQGAWVKVMGIVDFTFGVCSMRPLSWSILGAQPENSYSSDDQRLYPVYSRTKGVANATVEKLIASALDSYGHLFPALVPDEVVAQNRLMPIDKAIRNIHFPESDAYAKAARLSLKYREFFVMQAGLAYRKQLQTDAEDDLLIALDEEEHQELHQIFPFPLTNAQERSVKEICEDIATPGRMNRLLQGDVGSGKTAVALYAMRAANQRGWQCAILAPTEILARQHYLNISAYLKDSDARVELLVGGMKTSERAPLLDRLKMGDVDILIGTHAIIEKDVKFARLGLVIIDEQHKFGVKQRAALIKKGNKPHRLVMSATPIPRTLSLTVYGDLSVSVIDELPPGRKAIKTSWVPESARGKTLEVIKKRLAQGDQAYFVQPLVTENPDLELKSAEEAYKLYCRVFGEEQVRLIHGQMPNEEKDAAMQAFRDGKAKVLVATVVIEVGVDVPSANIMVIDHAERFGLSQLHQLRGRVGRGDGDGILFLFGNPNSEIGAQRLETICKTTNGFEIAEADLKLRGFGDFAGTRQSGIPRLKLGDPVDDLDILKQARKDAFGNIKAIDFATLKEAIQLSFGRQFSLVGA